MTETALQTAGAQAPAVMQERPASVTIAIRFTNEEVDIIRKTIAPAMPEPAFKWFVASCSAAGLNPILGEAYPLPFKDDGGNIKWIRHTGIDGFYKRAFASGLFQGWEETILTVKTAQGEVKETTMRLFDPDGTDTLVSATIGMHIIGYPHPARTTCHLKRYGRYNKEGGLQATWKGKPERMLEKCGQAKLIRENIPGCGSLYVKEEFESGGTGDFVDVEFNATEQKQVFPDAPRRGRPPKPQRILKVEDPTEEQPAVDVEATPVQESESAQESAPAETTPEPVGEASPEGIARIESYHGYLRTNYQVNDEGVALADKLICEKFGVSIPQAVPVELFHELKKFTKTVVLDTLQVQGFIQPPGGKAGE